MMMQSQSFGLMQELKLTQSQKLVQQIKNTILTPNGNCPKCNRELTEEEMRAGWRDDVADFTTKCPDCEARFQANLLLSKEDDEIGSIPFLCELQLMDGLKNVQRGESKRLGKNFLYNEHPHLLWNMVKHYGSYEEGLKFFKKENLKPPR